MKDKMVWLLCLFGGTTSSVCHATTTTPVSSTAMLIQALVGLFFVVVIIFFFAWIAKKLNLKNFGQQSDMQVKGVIALGSREKAVLIQVENTKLLVGIAPGQISALHVFPAQPQGLNGQTELEVGNGASQQRSESPSDTSLEVKNTESAVPPPSITNLAARSTSEFSKKLNSFLGQGIRR